MGRAQAYMSLGTTVDLELAVKDMARAAELDPSSANVAASLKTYRAALAEQTAKDKGTYGGMFGRGSIYSARDQSSMRAKASSDAKTRDAIEKGLKEGYFTPEAERERQEREKEMRERKAEMEDTRK